MKRMLTTTVIAGAMLAGSAFAASAATPMVPLHLRSGPGTSYGVVTTLPADAQFRTSGCEGGWCRVTYNGQTGYASEAYLNRGDMMRGHRMRGHMMRGERRGPMARVRGRRMSREHRGLFGRMRDRRMMQAER